MMNDESLVRNNVSSSSDGTVNSETARACDEAVVGKPKASPDIEAIIREEVAKVLSHN